MRGSLSSLTRAFGYQKAILYHLFVLGGRHSKGISHHLFSKFGARKDEMDECFEDSRGFVG
jgi:hypothetical protein